MTLGLIPIKSANSFSNEAEIEVFAVSQLKKAGYEITLRSCKSALLKKHWPSKGKGGPKAAGYPDVLLHLKNADKPVCVWENKGPGESAATALKEAQFYVEGLRKALPGEPALPFLAAGFNGKDFKLSLYTPDAKWVPIKIDGHELRASFPKAEYVAAGITANGTFTASGGAATALDLRTVLPKLKTLYRNIPTLASGRTPIDFTVAILTLKLIVEQHPDWGTWSEIPRFTAGAATTDQAIGERIQTLVDRILTDSTLKIKYGDIFQFHERSDTLEIAFSFSDVLRTIEKGKNNFARLHELIDQLPPLQGADFDIFGEVYQAIGDEATKKALGEFFTGRHIIAGVLPILLGRAGFDKAFSVIEKKTICDIACGTGGFLTEMLRLVRTTHKLSEAKVKSFAQNAFFGYDIGHANASRARVNMYFAGDGFSAIKGGFDSLAASSRKDFPKGGFDVIMTNPPYGKSIYGRIEEIFLDRAMELLKPGTGWLLVVLPTGVLENPRSAKARFTLLNQATITDVISLPKHAFAPYTQQRTGIVIAQKRNKALVAPGDGWEALIKAASNAGENVSMFIVDNDGFANSDKRYPTSRAKTTGEWLHNDLSYWIDTEGHWQPSKLVKAALLKKGPDSAVDEFDAKLGPKYGLFPIEKLAHGERALALLPDIPLRGELNTLSLGEWCGRVDAVQRFARGEVVTLPGSLREEVEFLLDHGLSISDSMLETPSSISSLFDVKKGDTGLTEAMIYLSIASNGLSVYGGGSGVPRFKADKTLKRASGEAATIYEGPAIIVSMDGSSGSMQVVEEGEFFCNHHGAVLQPKQPLALWCFAQIAEPALKRLASNKAGSATLTKPTLENFVVQMPKGNALTEISPRRKALTKLSRLF